MSGHPRDRLGSSRSSDGCRTARLPSQRAVSFDLEWNQCVFLYCRAVLRRRSDGAAFFCPGGEPGRTEDANSEGMGRAQRRWPRTLGFVKAHVSFFIFLPAQCPPPGILKPVGVGSPTRRGGARGSRHGTSEARSSRDVFFATNDYVIEVLCYLKTALCLDESFGT
jgi:hypothetical protein